MVNKYEVARIKNYPVDQLFYGNAQKKVKPGSLFFREAAEPLFGVPLFFDQKNMCYRTLSRAFSAIFNIDEVELEGTLSEVLEKEHLEMLLTMYLMNTKKTEEPALSIEKAEECVRALHLSRGLTPTDRLRKEIFSLKTTQYVMEYLQVSEEAQERFGAMFSQLLFAELLVRKHASTVSSTFLEKDGFETKLLKAILYSGLNREEIKKLPPFRIEITACEIVLVNGKTREVLYAFEVESAKQLLLNR